MRIREATPADYDAIADLTIAAYRALERWVGDDYAVYLADVEGRSKWATLLVAEDDEGTVIGSVALTLAEGEGFEWRYGVDGDCGFRMLAVDPAAQGQGAGPALVDECRARARAAGKTRMCIGSTPFMTTAHRIYERRGFGRVPEIDQQWGDIPGWAFAVDL